LKKAVKILLWIAAAVGVALVISAFRKAPGMLFFLTMCGIFTAIVASNRGGSGPAWFVLGFLFGPIGFVLAFFNKLPPCPYCQKSIPRGGSKCPYCQSDLRRA
jgi:hypothetical protein